MRYQKIIKNKEDKMRYRDILKVLAPCGLNCYKCFAYKDGEIRKVSLKLKELMGSFDKYAERFSKFLPVFENYPAFKELLIYLTEGDCKGCREGTCKYPVTSVFNVMNFHVIRPISILTSREDGSR